MASRYFFCFFLLGGGRTLVCSCVHGLYFLIFIAHSFYLFRTLSKLCFALNVFDRTHSRLSFHACLCQIFNFFLLHCTVLSFSNFWFVNVVLYYSVIALFFVFVCHLMFFFACTFRRRSACHCQVQYSNIQIFNYLIVLLFHYFMNFLNLVFANSGDCQLVIVKFFIWLFDYFIIILNFFFLAHTEDW